MNGSILSLVTVGALALVAELGSTSSAPPSGSPSRLDTPQRLGLGVLLVTGAAGALWATRRRPGRAQEDVESAPAPSEAPDEATSGTASEATGEVLPLRTSQNGWPAHPDCTIISVSSASIPLASGKTLVLPLRREVAPALVEFVQWWDRTIEPVNPGTTGSFAYRAIRGYSDAYLSNHSSGTAIDINSIQHRLGERGTVSAAQASAIVAKAQSLGLRWGGTYRGRADEMHVEVNTPPPAAAVAASLAAWRAKAGARVS